jgi:mRNA-degrading endonuclease toxin of MazEF toxin-antitoxin module
MLQQGSIVQAKISDPQGRNTKLRPLVIVTPRTDFPTAKELFAVAITGRFADPLQADEVKLPYHPGGLANSGLRKPCIAKCSWLVTLRPQDIVKQSGFLSANTLLEILRKLGQLKPTQPKPTGNS